MDESASRARGGAVLYTRNPQRTMRLIVGLGNPGGRYEGTRHNIGFRVADAFAAKFRIEVHTHGKDALTGKGRVSGGTVIIAKPTTFMNLSGVAVQKLIRAHLSSTDDLMVVYDDIDLPAGRLRLRKNGSPGTHNGMRSIVSVLGSDNFPRLRFGIRGEGYEASPDLATYVLEDFRADEEEVVQKGIDRAVEALVLFARGDLSRAMNEFNRDAARPGPSPESEGDS